MIRARSCATRSLSVRRTLVTTTTTATKTTKSTTITTDRTHQYRFSFGSQPSPRGSHIHRLQDIRPLACIEPRRYLSSSDGGDGGRSNRGDEKENFQKKYLRSAEEGKLKHHSSGIPRLAGRKGKGNIGASSWNTTRGAKGGRRWKDHTDNDEYVGRDASAVEGDGRQERPGTSTTLDLREEAPGKFPKFMSLDDPYLALEELTNEKKYYWDEEQFDDWFKGLDKSEYIDEEGNMTFEAQYTQDDLRPKPHDWLIDDDAEHEQFLEKMKKMQENNDESDDEDDDSDKSIVEDTAAEGTEEDGESPSEDGAEIKKKTSVKASAEKPDDTEEIEWEKHRTHWAERVNIGINDLPPPNPEQRFFDTESDIHEIVKRDDNEFPDKIVRDPVKEKFESLIIPLADPMGDGVEDFVEAMHHHPTEYASLSYEPTHPNSLREPKPMFGRKKDKKRQPPLDFVESYIRFLYVTGLPPHQGDIDDPINRSFLEKTVARLVGVDSSQVYVSDNSSAFVGFASPRELANAIQEGPSESTQKRVPLAAKFESDSFPEMKEPLKKFIDASTSPECLIHITDLPLRNNSPLLAKSLVPLDSELYEEFGKLSSDDVFIPSAGTALVRLSSVEQADSLLNSVLFQKRLEEIGTYPVHYLRARRELRHEGFFYKTQEVRVNGPRLVVDGLHVPSKQFYISHAGALQIRNLDPDVMDKEYLTRFFQKFSKTRRLKSSVEFIECEISGEPILGTAYIGFEEPQEPAACLENGCKDGWIKIGDRRAQVRLLYDRAVPRLDTTPEARPNRSLEELEDDLTNWEKYVNSEDVDYLDKNGVPRVVLDEMLRGVRRHNSYFGPLDGNITDEKIDGKKMGEEYRELVVMCVDLLKECASNRDDPGQTYLDMFYEDEEPDLSIFDVWEKEKQTIDFSRNKYKM